MSLFLNVVTDLIHVIKIVLLCEYFFVFERRSGYKKVFNLLALAFMFVVSVYIYFCNNKEISMAIYILATVVYINIIYKEKLLSMFVSTLWIIMIVSMLDTMTIVLVEATNSIVKIGNNDAIKLLSGSISFMFIFIVGKMYKKHSEKGIKTIGLGNLISFTFLTIADTFVVMVMAVTNIYAKYEIQSILNSVAFIIVILGIFVQLGAVILLYVQRNVHKEKEQITKKYLNEQINHYEYLEQREVETKRFRHDLRNHMQMLLNLAHNEQYDKIDQYLDVMNVKIETFGNVITVQNGIADAIINQYYARALQEDIKMDVKGMFPRECSVEAYDLCTILSNVLSNALEAAAKADEKKISMDCRYNDKNIIFVVKNTYKDFGQFKNDKLKTSKEDIDYHGYGLINIKESVEKYNGVLDIETINGEFILKVSLNYTRRNNEDSSRR